MDVDYKYVGAKLRELSELAKDGFIVTDSVLTDLANKVDPPRPEPGTVVWWREDGGNWQIGIVSEDREIIDVEINAYEFREVEWKKANVCYPGEMPFFIPPAEEWPKEATCIIAHFSDGVFNEGNIRRIITKQEEQTIKR